MAINSILATSGTVPGLSLHGHRNGVHGDSRGENTDPAESSAPTGSSQHLFSHLMGSTEEMIGVNPAAAEHKP